VAPKKRSLQVTLDASLVDAIRRYNRTDWHDGRDPSKLGALNAVAYIGERVAAIVRVQHPRAARRATNRRSTT